MPVIGFLGITFASERPERLAAFKRGLGESGFVDGRNVLIEIRWAENRYDRFQELAADLVRHKVDVIVAPGTAAAIAARSTTATIPIVFAVADDPVKLGLVASLSRPGANVTGINFFSAELVAKRLALLRELLPAAMRVAALINPSDKTQREDTEKQLERAARALGLETYVIHAASHQEIDEAFRRSRGIGPTHSSSAPMAFSTADGSNWPFWPRVIRSRRRSRFATTSKSEA